VTALLKYNMWADQGADFSANVTLTDSSNVAVNLTGYTFAGLIKKSYASSNSVTIQISCPTPSTGTILLSVPASNTLAMSDGRYFYDINATNQSNVTTKIIEGVFTVSPSATTP